MENSLKGLILAAGVVITCIVVGLGFYLSREASNSGNKAISQISEMTAEYGEIEKIMYDDTVVSGNEVLSAISKFEDDINEGVMTVTVFTGKSSDDSDGISFNNKSCDLASVKKKADTSYINPSGSFRGEITRDDNGVITGLIFRQE